MSTKITKFNDRFKDIALFSSAEAIAVGKALYVIKGNTPHGEFWDKINDLGLYKQKARHLMACARKFAGASPVLIEAIESASKMIEMLRLDAKAIAALDQGKAVCGLSIFQVRALNTIGLREALCAALGALDAPKIEKLSVDEELLLRNYRKCTNDAPKLIVQMARLLANKC